MTPPTPSLKARLMAFLKTLNARVTAALHKPLSVNDVGHFIAVLVSAFVASFVAGGLNYTKSAVLALIPAAAVTAYRQVFPQSTLNPDHIIAALTQVYSELRSHPAKVGDALTTAAKQIVTQAATSAASGANQKAIIDAAVVAGEASAKKVLDAVGIAPSTPLVATVPDTAVPGSAVSSAASDPSNSELKPAATP